MSGYIKYNRMLLDSTTFHREAPYIALFTHILLNVQYKDTYRNRTGAGQMETTCKSLGAEIGIEPHTVRRMLISMQNDGLITIENKQNRYTLITVNDWQLYKGAPSGWIQLERDIDWRKDAEYMGVKLYLLLATDYQTGKLNIDKIKLKTESLWKILRKLERENFITISKDKTSITLVNTKSYETDVKPLQNQCNSEIEPPQDGDNSTVIAYKDIKKKELKKEEERSEGDSRELAEKLSKVFVSRNFSQKDDIETLSKHISKLLKCGATPEQIADSIDWFSRNRFDPIFNGYTFREYFYALSETVQCEKREAERKDQTRIAEEKKRYLEEEEHEKGHKALKEATAKDKFYLVRTASKYPKIALMSLKSMIADGRTTAEEAAMLIKELNLQAV